MKDRKPIDLTLRDVAAIAHREGMRVHFQARPIFAGPWKRRVVWHDHDWCYQWIRRLKNGNFIQGPYVPRDADR